MGQNGTVGNERETVEQGEQGRKRNWGTNEERSGTSNKGRKRLGRPVFVSVLCEFEICDFDSFHVEVKFA
mgnify:CR=1 FL=1